MIQQIASERIGGQQLIAPGMDDYRVDTRGQVSTVLGDCGEEFMASALCAQRLETVRGRLCPDLRDRTGRHWEIKVAGPGGDGFPFFEQSMARYKSFLKAGHQLHFAVVFYDQKITAPVSRDRVRQMFVDSIDCVVVVPAARVLAHAARRNSIKSVRGNYRRVTAKWLLKHARRAHIFKASAYGFSAKMIQVLAAGDINGDRIGVYPAHIRTAAAEMLRDLRANHLEVMLQPAPRAMHPGHQVRTVIGRSPEWYQALCAEHPSARRDYMGIKFKTAIKRRGTISALQRIAENQLCGDLYQDRLLPFIEAWSRGEYWEGATW